MANDFISSILGAIAQDNTNFGSPNNEMSLFNSNVAANDPWRTASTAISAAPFNTKTWTPNQSIATNVGKAFLGSILGGIAQDREAEQTAKVNNVMRDLYRDPLSVDAPEGVDKNAFNALKASMTKNAFVRQQEQEDLANKIKGSIAQELFSKRPDLAMEALGIKDTSSNSSSIDPLRTTAPVDPLTKALSSGGLTPAEKIQQYANYFSKTMPATQAGAAAREQVESELKMNKDSIDHAKNAREYGQKLLDLGNTSEAALSQIGSTGGWEGLKSARDFLEANVLGDQQAQTRRVGRDLLGSVAPEFIKMNRSPGAVSDFESKALMRTGPNTANTPEANQLIVDKLKDLGQLNMDYADFLDAYGKANSGSTKGADEKWAKYRKDFPLVVGSGDSVSINKDRPGWQDYFSGNYNKEDYGQAKEYKSSQDDSLTTIPDSIAQQFNGKKILSIKKIK